MRARKAIFGLAVMCALMVSAVAAQGAFAIEGTTAYTCKATTGGGAGFSDAHCTNAVASGASFTHVAITQGQTTEITLTNAGTKNNTTEATNGILKTTVSGVPIEMTATGVHGVGTATNNVDPNNEHYVSGEGETIEFTGVTTNIGCEVVGLPGGAGTVKTKPIKATTTEQGMKLKFSPKEGTLFAEFEFTGAGCASPGVKKVFGTVAGVPNGATTVFTHNEITESGTLHFGSAVGPKAGLEGKVTISGRANSTEAYTPLAATTVTT